MNNVVAVVAAVIRGREGKILIARRPAHLHQGNKWEFPGGKIEAGETPQRALARELKEELAVVPIVSRPLIQVLHHYPDKSVFLDVWEVVAFSGQPKGLEGQMIEWVNPAALANYEFPAANVPIVKAARLPLTWLITPEPADMEPDHFFAGLESALEQGAGGVIVRTRSLAIDDAQALMEEVAVICEEYEVPHAFNGPADVRMPKNTCRHLSEDRLCALVAPPDEPWSASCHSPEALSLAARFGAEFALLSPVNTTVSHPGQTPLGWETFAGWAKDATLPVYALGGMKSTDVMLARQHGGQGVAGISGFWSVSPSA